MSDDSRGFPNVPRRNWMQDLIELPVLVRVLHIPTGRRMLEVGCGRGNAFAALHRLCAPIQLTGRDVDGSLLAVAAEVVGARRLPVALVHGDVRALPFADESFDVVLDFGTCYHIPAPAAALREIARVLRCGGVFVAESRLNQLLAHPLRSSGKRLPWQAVPELAFDRHVGFWSRSVKR